METAALLPSAGTTTKRNGVFVGRFSLCCRTTNSHLWYHGHSSLSVITTPERTATDTDCWQGLRLTCSNEETHEVYVEMIKADQDNCQPSFMLQIGASFLYLAGLSSRQLENKALDFAVLVKEWDVNKWTTCHVLPSSVATLNSAEIRFPCVCLYLCLR